MVPAAMTESPIAVTSRPWTARDAAGATGLAAGTVASRGAPALVAAPTRSPLTICCSMPLEAAEPEPAEPAEELKMPHPAAPAIAAQTAAITLASRLVTIPVTPPSAIFLILAGLFRRRIARANTGLC